jgi:hypothetical protein
MFRLVILLPAAGVIALGFQQEAGPSFSSSRDQEVYAIYSFLMSNRPAGNGPDRDQRYLIRDVTVPGTPAEPCVQPPKERAAEFAEVLADYHERRNQPRRLKRALQIQRPYELLTPAQAREFVDDRIGPQRRQDEKFRGVIYLYSFSEVYFNRRETLALTALTAWCGSLCASIRWRVLEKDESGKWRELAWVSCATMALARRPGFPGRLGSN